MLKKWIAWMAPIHPTGLSVGLLILRLGVGSMMLFAHGYGKLTGLINCRGGSFPDPIGLGNTLSMVLATSAEFGCSLLIVLGLATRLAAIPLVITMSVAVFVVHADDPWSKKEFALLYLVPCLALFFTGAGRFSLDAALGRR